jgi:hypothetical protein
MTDVHDPAPWCACGAPLQSPRERCLDKCAECAWMDMRMLCAVCEKFVGMAYVDGSPTLCSDACEAEFWR